MKANCEPFGRLPDGHSVDAIRLSNGGMSVRILTLGGIVQSILAPDREGRVADIALGFPTLDGYENDLAFHGAIVGRYANRIANGRFILDGCKHQLQKNSGANTLHGGIHGFNRAIWQVQSVDETTVVLQHRSPDGDQGFPGNVNVRATYSVHDSGVLQLDFEAEADAPTVVNLTNHTYWNLDCSDNVLDHRLQVHADAYTPVDSQLIPTGEVRPVDASLFDFRKPVRLRERVAGSSDLQIAIAGGVDHNFILQQNALGELVHAATLADSVSGRVLDVWTTEPGMQVYTGNNLGGGRVGKLGTSYPRWSGIALETQHFPNSPNEASFPSTVLRPGMILRSQTRFCLSTKDH